MVRKDFLLSALLRENFFPMQKKKKDELPPTFTSSDLTKAVAEKVRNLKLDGLRKKDGFDAIQYKATRFNKGI